MFDIRNLFIILSSYYYLMFAIRIYTISFLSHHQRSMDNNNIYKYIVDVVVFFHSTTRKRQPLTRSHNPHGVENQIEINIHKFELVTRFFLCFLLLFACLFASREQERYESLGEIRNQSYILNKNYYWLNEQTIEYANTYDFWIDVDWKIHFHYFCSNSSPFFSFHPFQRRLILFT